MENDDAIPSTLPDLSIIYKLHLESRKLINMYDWLQVTIRFVFTGKSQLYLWSRTLARELAQKTFVCILYVLCGTL